MPDDAPHGNAFAVAFSSLHVSFAAVLARAFKYWLPLLLWMCLIFAASTSAGSPRVSSFFLRPFLHWIYPGMSEETFDLIHTCVRKTGHLTEYAILGYFVLRAIQAEPALSRLRLPSQLALALLFAACYATTDEFHQRFVATRHSSPVDVLVDTVGASFGIGGMALSQRLAARRLPERA